MARGIIFRTLLCALTAVMLAATASAGIVEFPDSVTFHEVPEVVDILVENTTGVRQPLEIDLYVPVSYTFIEKPSWLEPRDTATVRIRFTPKAGLTGLVYESTVLVTLGNQASDEKITMTFEKATECPVEISSTAVEGSEETLKYEITIENPSVRDLGIGFEGIEDAPADWGYEIDYPTGTVNSLGDAKRNLTITPASAYTGKISLVFECEGYGKITHEIEVERKGTGILAGFASLADFSGLNFSIPAFGFPALGLSAETEFMVDIALGVIAAGLLIALIVRFARKRKSK